MSERRRPFRRGRRPRSSGHQPHTPFSESYGDVDPYLDTMDSTTTPPSSPAIPTTPPPSTPAPESSDSNSTAGSQDNGSENLSTGAPPQSQQQSPYNPQTTAGQGG